MKCKLCNRKSVARGYCGSCYEKLKRSGDIEVKKHKDNLMCGVGNNDMPRGWANQSEINKRIRKLWYNMIERCYRKETLAEYPTYKDCYVCDRWLVLSNFVEDINKIKNYKLWLENPNKHICLDKDINSKDFKCYSLDSCVFIENNKNSKEAQFRHKRNKQVVRISDDGTIKIYESTIAPQHEDGFSQACVSSCCIGKAEKHKGYKWMFLEDYNNSEQN